jgi:hypothetical protein
VVGGMPKNGSPERNDDNDYKEAASAKQIYPYEQRDAVTEDRLKSNPELKE